MDAILSKLFLAESASSLSLALFFSSLGEIKIIAILTLVIIIWFWIKNRKTEALLMGGGMALAGLAIYVLKIIIARARPEFALIDESTYSFPSGHALGATVFFMMLAYFQTRNASRQKKILLWFSAVFLILMISWSRLALGVHWT